MKPSKQNAKRKYRYIDIGRDLFKTQPVEEPNPMDSRFKYKPSSCYITFNK